MATARVGTPQTSDGAEDGVGTQRSGTKPAPERGAAPSHLKRRGVIAAAAALLAGALTKITERAAHAADGNPLVLGRTNTETTTTVLSRSNPSVSDDAVRVTNDNGSGLVGIGSVGVRGQNLRALSPADIGVEGVGGTGVVGRSSVLGGVGVQGSGRTGVLASGSNIAVQAAGGAVGLLASGSLGVDASGSTGVVGRSSLGVGVRGTGPIAGPPASLPSTGVLGEGSDTGVRGVATIGVLGEGSATGVRGDGSNTGVLGNTTDGSGVMGDAAGAGNGVVGTSRTGAGVLAQNAGGPSATLATTTLAGEFFGDVVIHGQLTFVEPPAAAVAVADGSRRPMYGVGSPRPQLEDVGSGQVVNGVAQVALDPDFAATVRTDDYHVFLTPRGDSNGLYVTGQGPTGFTVREQRGGTSSIAFSYRVIAKRRDVAARRPDKALVLNKPPDRVPTPSAPPELKLPPTPTIPELPSQATREP